MFLAFLAAPGEVLPQSAGDLGEAQGNSVLNIYGSKSGITNNVSNPLTSSNTPMTTVDGSTSFSGQLQCPNSQKFMEVLIQPGATGDIDTFIVSQDTNFDGTLDYTFRVPFPVSGICANGVITCDPGAWTNCRTYRWTSDTSGRVSLQPVDLTALGGCFCVNNSCGSNLVFGNTQTIMNVIGGGVAGAIQANDTRYAISNVVIDGMDATYYGQNSGACTASAFGPANAEQYYYNPGSMSADAATQAAEQAEIPTSVYSTLKTSDAAGNYQTATCTIARGDMMAWDTSYQCYIQSGISNGCTVLENNPNCQLQSETIDGVVTVNNYVATGLEPLSSCQVMSNTLSAGCNYVCPGDGNWSVPCLDSPVCVVGSQMAVCSSGVCPLGQGIPCSSAPTCMLDGQAQLCQVQNPIQEAVGGWNNGIYVVASGNVLHFYTTIRVYSLDYQIETGHVTFAPGITLTASVAGPDFLCGYAFGGGNTFGLQNSYYGMYATFTISGATVSGFSSDPFAGLLTSSVSTDGTSLFISGTGLNRPGGDHYGSGSVRFDFSPDHCPLPGATACSGSPPECYETCTQNDCEPWWTKTRTYTCTTSGYDFSSIQKRVSTITQTAQDDTSSMSYNDYYLSGSTWVTGSSTYATNNVYRGNIGSCRQACKTVMNVDNTSTNVASKKSDISLDATTPVYYYHACTSAGCPAGTGETIVTDCQCIDDFAEAAVIMQTLRKGAQDIICSDGTEIGLQ
jgi:hypothetical protein